MADRSILFRRPHQISALIREAQEPGTGKSMHREALKPQPKFGFQPWQDEGNGNWMQSGHGEAGDDFLAVPYAVGDRLWVKESWRSTPEWDAHPPRAIQPGYALYEADGPWVAHSYGKLRPSLFMPRWASRLTLIVAEVRVERLNDIGEADAVAEGLASSGPAPGHEDDIHAPPHMGAVENFAGLWNSLHGPDAWQADPWVSVTRFRPILANIDAISTEAEPSQGPEVVR